MPSLDEFERRSNGSNSAHLVNVNDACRAAANYVEYRVTNTGLSKSIISAKQIDIRRLENSVVNAVESNQKTGSQTPTTARKSTLAPASESPQISNATFWRVEGS